MPTYIYIYIYIHTYIHTYTMHSFILSCWFVAFSLALVVLFLLLTSFIVCHAIRDCYLPLCL